MKQHPLPLKWLHARRIALVYLAAVLGIFVVVYALHGYPWGVAGYALLLALVLGAALALWDYIHFKARHQALRQLCGQMPLQPLPAPHTQIEKDYTDIINQLEAERLALEKHNEHLRRDAEEYYTLWAHQIKTPMAAMTLLLQSQREAIGTTAANQLQQELFRMGQYVDMVLQYQRLSSLQKDLVLGSFSLASLVKKAAKGCAPLFIYKGLGLDMDEVAGTITTDEKWFCFVLEQLFTNAVKYTDKGVIRVLSPEPTLLVIEDPGIGIPPEDLPRVFERGFTGAVGRAERSSTGIGLYLCRRILGRLGFGISIQSQPGRGTKVLLHLEQQPLDLD